MISRGFLQKFLRFKSSEAAQDELQAHRNFVPSGENDRFTPVIGLEVHCQPWLNSKLFTSSSGDNHRALANSNVSHFDMSMPGTLPVLNKKSVELGIKTAFLLGCRINYVSKFDRKHYFYADLPIGYQITQQRIPLAVDGFIDYFVPPNKADKNAKWKKKRTKILKIQLEQDSGKSLWDERNKRTLVDLNRAGVALMEIVTEPNIGSGLEAASLVKELHFMLKSTGICLGHMERGHMRVDANVSLADKKHPELGLGVRTEVKNINSFKFVQRAVEFELQRHRQLIEAEREVVGETRVYDYKTGMTTGMRDKEVWLDYRFMPEPNLPPLRVFDSENGPHPPIDMEKEQILDCAQMLNTLDQGKLVERHQWIDTGMPIDVALQVCADDSLYQFFHESTKLLPLGLLKFFSSVTFGEYLPTLRIKEMELLSSPITVATFVNLVTLLHLEKITRIAFKKILNLLLEGVTESPEMIVSRLNLHRKNDMVEVERVCLQVIEENPKASRDFKKGKEKVLSLLVAKADQLLNHRVDTAILEDFYRRNC